MKAFGSEYKSFRRLVRKVQAIPRRQAERTQSCAAVTKPRIGGVLGSVFPLGVSFQAPDENNPAGRDDRCEFVLGSGGKSNARVRL